ncbi:MAG: hypothetical protein VX100_02345 [Pseudomonadota bacterium]|nr:hypothetical protein [Pseudomonadota bacterium]
MKNELPQSEKRAVFDELHTVLTQTKALAGSLSRSNLSQVLDEEINDVFWLIEDRMKQTLNLVDKL